MLLLHALKFQLLGTSSETFFSRSSYCTVFDRARQAIGTGLYAVPKLSLPSTMHHAPTPHSSPQFALDSYSHLIAMYNIASPQIDPQIVKSDERRGPRGTKNGSGCLHQARHGHIPHLLLNATNAQLSAKSVDVSGPPSQGSYTTKGVFTPIHFRKQQRWPQGFGLRFGLFPDLFVQVECSKELCDRVYDGLSRATVTTQ